MRKVKVINKFMPKGVKAVANRLNKIKALDAIGTSDSRKARKAMNVHQYGRSVTLKTDGFYGKRKPVRIKIGSKSRRSLAAMKAIMRLQY